MIRIDIDEFSGPMDLLLQLIDKDKINIYDIPICEITEQYLEHVNQMEVDADSMADFIVMAATLLEIKSKYLLPTFEELEEDPRQELVSRILEYKQYKLLSGLFGERWHQSQQYHHRIPEELVIETDQINLPEDIRLLTSVFYGLLQKYEASEEEEPFDRVIIDRDNYSIETFMETVQHRVQNQGKVEILELLTIPLIKKEIIALFMAILELVRRRTIFAKQDSSENIVLYKRELEN
ncbi:MAG: segregation/condensation protein A [Tissierellia bacterium]|nr:segregation/condensation protein A [Tissierellia bacterium]